MRSFQLLIASVGMIAGSASAATDAPLGVVYQHEEVYVDLSYKNRAPQPILITGFKSSCECLKVLVPHFQLQPGDTGVLPTSYKSSEPGPVHVEMSVLGGENGGPLETFHVHGYVAAKDWVLSCNEATQKRDSLIFVDVRSAQKFAALHIPRAINLPLFTLKSRGDLKNKPVVLLDDGVSPEVLLEEVRRLRALGYSRAMVLPDGMSGWVRAGGPVEGPASFVVSVATITPAEVERGMDKSPWSVIQYSEGQQHSQGGATLVTNLQSLGDAVRAVNNPGASGGILIVTDNIRMNAVVEASLAAAKKTHRVFYLEGGKPAFTEWAEVQKAVANEKGQLVRTKPAAGRPYIAGRCGSCGGK